MDKPYTFGEVVNRWLHGMYTHANVQHLNHWDLKQDEEDRIKQEMEETAAKRKKEESRALAQKERDEYQSLMMKKEYHQDLKNLETVEKGFRFKE